MRDHTVLQFMYTTSQYMEEVQYYSYGLHDLIADFGGYLGLLLGHSLLSFFDIGRHVQLHLNKVKGQKCIFFS